MNKKMLSMMAALALIIAAGVAPALAQEAQVTAHIPFTFAVKGSVLPAGDYSLGQLHPNSWVIRNEGRGRAVIALTRPEGDNEKESSAQLVFKRCGDRYFLSEVWYLGRTSAVPPSEAEKAMEREMARNDLKPETLYVLASVR